MSYLALYRKYRPATFEEVFGQKYIVDIIKKSVLNGKISHAYLFSGPRGTGKTTIAKLVAKMINCTDINRKTADPCNKCPSCSLIVNKSNNPDIIEIDAASNNGVDEVRIIRDKASLLPAISKYKVYIIDEVHMLSISAFNALLKTIEEPPAHVVFILATTELHKVPETIISRCQCYQFERLKNDEIISCLKKITKNEKLNVDDEVFDLIASYSNGGMRDSISLLDKLCCCSDHVDKSLFYDVVGLVDDEKIINLINILMKGTYKDCVEYINDLEKNGKNLNFMISQIVNYVKNEIVSEKNVFSVDKLLLMINELDELQYKLKISSNVFLSFEVGMLKILTKLNEKSDDSDHKIISREIILKEEKINNFKKQTEKTLLLKDKNQKSEQKDINVENVDFDIIINNAFALADKKLKNEISSKWKGFYDYVHNKEFSSIVSYLLDGNLQVVGEKDVIISVGYASVLDGAVSNINKIELLFNLVMGKNYNIAFVLDSKWNILKEKYINDIKNGNKYEYILENKEKNDIIKEEDVVSNNISGDYLESEKSASEIFGNDIVEIK